MVDNQGQSTQRQFRKQSSSSVEECVVDHLTVKLVADGVRKAIFDTGNSCKLENTLNHALRGSQYEKFSNEIIEEKLLGFQEN